jgi:cobalamin synthase
MRKDFTMTLDQAKANMQDWATGVTAGAQAIMSFASILSSLSSLVDTWSNPDLSGWEKFTRTLSTCAMSTMMLISAFNALTKAQEAWQKGTMTGLGVSMKKIVMTKLESIAAK